MEESETCHRAWGTLFGCFLSVWCLTLERLFKRSRLKPLTKSIYFFSIAAECHPSKDNSKIKFDIHVHNIDIARVVWNYLHGAKYKLPFIVNLYKSEWIKLTHWRCIRMEISLKDFQMSASINRKFHIPCGQQPTHAMNL